MWTEPSLVEMDLFATDLPSISSLDIEKIIQKELFQDGVWKSSPQSEGSKAIPMMSISFHRRVFTTGNIPTPSEYLSDYEAENSDFIRLASEEQVGGMRSRAMRAYPSLVRDVHFVSVARELGYPAQRTLKDDLAGVDAIMPTETGNIAIRLYYDSARSRKHKLLKAIHHDIGRFIDYGLSRDNRMMIGNIYLYSTAGIQELLLNIKAIKSEEVEQ